MSRTQIGDPEGNFISGMLTGEVGQMAVYAEDLAHMGPVQIGVNAIIARRGRGEAGLAFSDRLPQLVFH